MTTLNIRIEEDLKKKATKALAGMGLDMSSAVKLFLHQTVQENGLPFHPTNNPKVIRAIWDREVEEAMKNGKSYTSTKEMFDDIIKGK
jgi:DNA-damage-inducible protein J